MFVGKLLRVLAAGVAVLVGGGLAVVTVPTPALAQGNVVVSDTFTGATANPLFDAYGSACLTGAPAGPPPGPGLHPLAGCSANAVGPVPPPNGAPNGYLQLTDASPDQMGAVLFNQPIPSSAGLEITFEQWQYGSTTPTADADGISFFLVDGAGQLTAPGGFGGSLGYAQLQSGDDPANPFLPGVDNGYLGIGFDVLGNYFGDWEQRGNGCATRSPSGTGLLSPAPGENMVTVRGPGNGTEGYCFLTATTSNFSTTGPWPSTLPGQLQGPLTTLPPDVTPAQAEALLEPSKRTVRVRVGPGSNPQVTIEIDFNDGAGFQQVLSFVGPPAPETYKFGFAGTTGQFTDVHLIRNLEVRTAAPLVGLTLTKQVAGEPPLPPIITAGTPVPYEFVVRNDLEIPVDNIVIDDPMFPSTECTATSLPPGATMLCRGTYVVTQEDVDRGLVVNTAIARGDSPIGPVESNPSQVDLPLETGEPSLQLVKIPDPTVVTQPGQTVRYTYQIINTGVVTIREPRIEDIDFSGAGTLPPPFCPFLDLAPGQRIECDSFYEVTPEDFTTGAPLVNTARAVGTTTQGEPVVSNLSTGTVEVAAVPALALVKSVSPTTVATAGETVTYSFLVTNPGNVPLSGLTIDETAFTGGGSLSPVVCPVTDLPPTAQTTCTATYTVTQADIDAGSISNTATATGLDPAGNPTTSDESSASVVATAAGGLSSTKVASPSVVSAAGQEISYSQVVTNTGNQTITGLTVTDVAFSGTGAPPVFTCPVTTLAPGEQTTCTGTYSVPQSDLDAGAQISNTATAAGVDPGGATVTSPPSTALVDVAVDPTLDLVKSVDPSTVAAAGETLTYAFLAANSGNVTLTGLVVTETAFSGTGTPPTITCPVTTLAPGAQTTCTGTYTVTQADIDAGLISNTATATGTTPAGGTVTSEPSSATVPVEVASGLSVSKVADPSVVSAAGEEITYSYVVTNNGGVTLTGVAATDVAFSGTGTPPTITCPVTTLAPGEQTTCTGTYSVPQSDLDAGAQISNTATAAGVDPGGATVTSPPSTALVDVTVDPSVALVKSVDVPVVTEAGQTVTYSFLAVNNGNVTLTGLAVTETVFTGTGTPPVITCPTTTLAPGEQTTCTGAYTITQADIDAGAVDNTATATGTTPAGGTTTSPDSSARVEVTAGGGLSVTKVADPAVVSAAGQEITYSYVVTNTGGVALTGVAVTDVTFSGTGTPPVITCPVTTLAPGAQTTCTGTYTVPQSDLDAGDPISNTAIVTGTDPGGNPVTSPESTSTAQVVARPSLVLVKSVDLPAVTGPGQTVTYSFLAVNNGNVTLTGLVVDETTFTGTGTPPVITCPVTTLAPGTQTTCTGTYTVTQADLDAGSINDTATATGTTPDGGAITSEPSSATVAAAVVTGLTATKTVDPATFTAAGQELTFTIGLTNTGTVTLADVTITEIDFTGSGPLPAPTCPPEVASLPPGGTVTCTTTYPVTQADIEAGAVSNTVTATGTPPGGLTPPVSPPATATAAFGGASRLGLTKTARIVDLDGDKDDKGYQGRPGGKKATPGDRIDWTITVTNLGVTSIGEIAVDDSLTGAADCPATELAPGESMTCSVPPYFVTAGDARHGAVTNIANASGRTATGALVTAEPAVVTIEVRGHGLPVTGGEIRSVFMVGVGIIVLGGLLLLVTAHRLRRRSH